LGSEVQGSRFWVQRFRGSRFWVQRFRGSVVLGSLLRLSGYAGQAGLEGRGVRLKAKGKRTKEKGYTFKAYSRR
jgi:hypothetical protein